MKKKILIVFPAMYVGGAEQSLLSLLRAIDVKNYDIDLFLFRHTGELFSKIPEAIHILPEMKEYRAMIGPVMESMKKGCISVSLGRLLGKHKASRFAKKHKIDQPSSVRIDYSHRYTRRYLPRINPNVEYDLAISFITPHYIVAEKVNAKKKAAWIHTDYSKVDVDERTQLEMWQPYDHIIAVSDHCARAFHQRFPSLSDKVSVIENLMDVGSIRTSAELSVEDEMPTDGCIKFLSVGRFCEAKNFDNIPEICSLLRQNGWNIKWYIIGFGDHEALIRQKILEHRVSDYVIILGKKVNPYPYVKACDIYVQPSRYEGKAVTVIEAQILAKPVIITDFPTASSQLTDGIDGVIVPLQNRACAEAIGKLLSNKETLQKISHNTKQRDYSNVEECRKIYAMI